MWTLTGAIAGSGVGPVGDTTGKCEDPRGSKVGRRGMNSRVFTEKTWGQQRGFEGVSQVQTAWEGVGKGL